MPYLTPDHPVRVGAPVTFNQPVILDYRNNAWKFQPATAADPGDGTVQPVTFANTRRRPGVRRRRPQARRRSTCSTTSPPHGRPARAGCTFYNDRDGNPITVRTAAATPAAPPRRGTSSASRTRSSPRSTSLGADVVSLEEIENSRQFGERPRRRLAKLVDALNARHAGGSGPSSAAAARSPAAERTSSAPPSSTRRPRPSRSATPRSSSTRGVRQRPRAARTGLQAGGADDDKKFSAIVNHFKSKGSGRRRRTTPTGARAPRTLARTAQAQSLLAFADELQKSKGTDKVFLIGDFNAYTKEDPINVLTAAGYVNQDERPRTPTVRQALLPLRRPGGLAGPHPRLPGANAVVTGADIWNINSVESVALEYSRYNNNVTDYYARTSSGRATTTRWWWA